MGDEAKTFDDLTPEESKKRLAEIVVKIDKDKNGLVTEAELQAWIKFTQKRYIYEVGFGTCRWGTTFVGELLLLVLAIFTLQWIKRQ